MPDDLAAELRDAVAGMEAARARRDELIVKALRGGASVREVGAHVGLTGTQIMNIGHAAGWPTEEIKAQRAAERAENDRWRRLTDN